MDLVISPVAVRLNAAFEGGGAQTLQPGQVVDALVAKVIDPTHVQLALGATLIDVLTKVPLAAGSRVQLAVKATPDGIRLVLVHPAPSGVEQVPDAPSRSSPKVTPTTTPEQGSVAREGPVVSTPTGTAPAAALAAAARSAATTQSGLAPLLADAAVAVTLKGLPEPVRQAALKLLSHQLPSDTAVAADHLRQAFARSGLFLEANLEAVAAKSPLGAKAGAAAPAPAGDLKAALVDLRATLAQASGSARVQPTTGQGAAGAGEAAFPGAIGAGGAGTATAVSAAAAMAAGRAAIVDAQGFYRALLQAVGETGAALPSSAAVSASVVFAAAPAAGKPEAGEPLSFADGRPPPPYRGALPAAQPQVPASVEATQPLDKIMQALLSETEGALARQTLLQAASLPDQANMTAATHKPDAAMQRWAYEIPFATPQGPAIAQFEITGDARGRGQDHVAPIWRARFAIDIEPLGAVHAQIAVMGERTAVTLWAERAESAALMREGAQTLAEDLRAADLEPLEVIVRDGAPRPQGAATRSAGRFLDRAS